MPLLFYRFYKFVEFGEFFHIIKHGGEDMDKSEYLKQFGRRVHYYRELNGMTLQELSDKSGYTSRSTVAKLEKGQVDAPQSKVKALADALGVSPLDLLGRTPNRFQAYADRLSQLSEKDQERALKMIDSIIQGFEE